MAQQLKKGFRQNDSQRRANWKQSQRHKSPFDSKTHQSERKHLSLHQQSNAMNTNSHQKLPPPQLQPQTKLEKANSKHLRS